MNLNHFDDLGSQAISNLYLQTKNLILAGFSDREFIAGVSSVLDDSLKKKAITYANTARAIYYQTAEDLTAAATRKSGEPVYWEYVGPADSKNRDECVWGLEKAVFTDEERKAFEADYGVRYNCRHTFMQIPEEIYNEGEKTEQDLSQKEINRRAAVLELFKDK